MPIFDVIMTVASFKRQADDSQMKVERVLGRSNGLVGANANNAVALAALELPKDIDKEALAQALITVKNVTA